MTEHDTPITTPVVGVGDRPIFVVGAPGNGAEHLVPALLASPGAWDATAVVAEVSAAGGAVSSRLEAALEERRSGIDWSRLPGDASPRMIAVLSDPERELATLLDLFPDAIVVQVHRSPEAVLAEAGDAEAAAEGWARAARQFLSRAEALPDDRCVTVAIESLLAEPDEELQRLFRALGLGWSRRISNVWRKSAVRLLPSRDGGSVVLADAEELQALDAKVRERVPALRPSLLPTSGDSGLTALDNGLASLLRRLGSSLLVSTYQTDRLISLRAVPGGLGVHLRAFDRPMGMAVFPGGLAVGIRSEILEYRDLPEAASGLEPKGLYDACYLPRNSHVTGDIAVHDLGVGRDGLWAVATQFSCLATLDAQHSFVPRWQPPFITALAPEDRCHLNGMAIVDGLPRYATALGVSDEAGGWRPGKASGGVLMKVPTGEVLVEGLSMPHSPRWHEGKLYVLESGRGRLLAVDPETGETAVVAELPGFTRGLGIHRGFAFVGTSQVRETVTFGGLPIAERGDLECGVWAIELTTGRVAASVTFEDRIQELFEVAVLAGVKHPEVAEWGSDLARTSWTVPRPEEPR